MTYWILLAIAVVLSFMSIAIRHINILVAFGASMAWLTLMAYNLTTPPAGITVGSTVHQWLTLVFLIVAIAVFMMWVRNRGRTESVTRVGLGKGEVVAGTAKKEGVSGRGLLGMNDDEYRTYIRKTLHPNRRRR